MKKRVLSLLLCLIMALSLIPTAAFADDGNTSTADADKTTNGAYTNGIWAAANNGGSITTDDGLILSKTATAVEGQENTYRIDLSVVTTQTTTTTTTSAAAATVLVIDTSGSMAWCTKNHRHTDSCYIPETECTRENNPGHYWDNGWHKRHTSCIYDWSTGKYYQCVCDTNEHTHNGASGGNWCGNSALNSATDSRIAKAKAAAQAFLDSYKDTTAARWIAIVSFDDEAASKGWFDVSTTDGYNSAVAAINELGASGATNLNAGLKAAQSLMDSDSITAVPEANRNVIALTDGTPTMADRYGNGSSGSPDINSTTTNTATALKKNINSLYTICFAASGEVCYRNGPTVAKFLSDIASDGKNYTVEDGNQLPTTFVGISTTITSGLTGEGGWTVTDPMADNISVTGSLPTGFVQTDATNNIYTWTLSDPTVSGNGDTKTYTYTTSYTVTIDPAGLEENTFYPTNKVTTLNYTDANGTSNTANFPVPGVKVKLPAPTTGTLVITKHVEGNVTLTEDKTFTFEILKDNAVVDEIDVIVDAKMKSGTSYLRGELTVGETYTVREKDANIDGYKLTTTYSGTTNGSDVTIGDANTNIGVLNTYEKVYGETVYNPASLTIVKKDARTDALLSGATFQLSKKNDATGKFEEFGTAITPATGSITFDDLLPGSYELKETAAPSDYVGWTERTFSFSVVAKDTGESRYNEETKKYDTVYNCSIEFNGDPSEEHIVGNNIFYRNYSYLRGTLTIYNERIETVTIPVKKIVEAPYAPADEKEFTFHVVLAPDSNNTYQFDNVDLLSDLNVFFNGEKLTYDEENEWYSFTLKASSAKAGEGNLTLTGTRNDLNGLKVIVSEEDESEKNPNWTYAEDPCGALLSYSQEANKYVLVNDDDETVKVPFTFTNTYVKMQPITATLDITKNVVRERGSRRPGSADFTFEASYIDFSNLGEKEERIKFASLTIQTTGGEKSYQTDWELTVPVEAFDEYGRAVLVISERNDKRKGWTYDNTEFKLVVYQDGDVRPWEAPQALNDEEEVPGINLEFTNSYYKRTSSPNPPEDKPIKSVNTGDMGIAMYAMTSLLSLGGAALVIKKRKDEE